MSERKRFVVRTVTASDCLSELPVLQRFSGGDDELDVLIAAAGFEERVLAVPQRIRQEGKVVRGAVLVGRYTTNASDNEHRFDELRPLLQAFEVPLVEFNADDPTEVASVLAEKIGGGPAESLHVGFDVSGASSTFILAVMAALANLPGDIQLTIYYTTAKEYDEPQSDGVNELVLEAPREVGTSTDPLSSPFSGHHHDHLPVSVIALPSLYTDRLEACLAHLNVGPITGSSDNLFWLLPATGVSEHKWRQDHTRAAVTDLMLRLQGRSGEDAPREVIRPDDMVTCDVLDYADTVRRIVTRIDELTGRNISIVHMGSKLQGIGVALAALARSEAAVLTVRPASFNAARYSSGIDDTYVLKFSSLAEVVSTITKIGSLEVSSL